MGGPSEHTEVERKYDAVADARGFPSLDEAMREHPELGVLGVPITSVLEATYFDTADLALLAHRVTLRRRTGGGDAGWHLKLPASGDARRELHSPLGRASDPPPRELLDRVRAYVRGRPVSAVAVLRTERTERHLVATDGTDLAVIADDHVQGRRLVGGNEVATEWREVEVELVDGPPRVLDDVDSVMTATGLRPSMWRSKLARALGDAMPQSSVARAPHTEPSPRKATAGDVLVGYLADQVEQLLGTDDLVRADLPEAVHDMRVLTRRVRSQLATFRPLVDRERTDPLREELRWLGAQLGKPRDAEVQRDRVLALVDGLDRELVVGPVRQRVETELTSDHVQAHADLVATLDSDRYWRLLDLLDALVADPPLRELASGRARSVLPPLVNTAARRVDRTARKAELARPGTETEQALHEVRKAAKRARYASELATCVAGRQATNLAERMERVQDILGELQDSVTARGLLRELAAAASAAGENAYTYGVLNGVENERARAARGAYPPALRAAQRRKVRDWCR